MVPSRPSHRAPRPRPLAPTSIPPTSPTPSTPSTKIGRPKKSLSVLPLPVQVERLAGKLTMEQMADFFGIGAQTLRARFLDDPVLSIAYKKGRQSTIDLAATRLLTLVRKNNLSAIIFYLKTQGHWRETSRVDQFNHDLSDWSDAELEQLQAGAPVEKIMQGRGKG